MSLRSLRDLEEKLAVHSHSEAALEEIKSFSKDLANTGNRLTVFNADGAIIRKALLVEDARALGFDTEDDRFTLLQGDIVITESAYFLGERVSGYPKYVVLNSSCDLVPNRRQCASLLRITEIRESDPEYRNKLSLLLKFARRDSMYLPAMPFDAVDVICNVVQFDGICQIRSPELLLANRVASLSHVGWRIFASFARTVIARTTPREGQMRAAIDNQPKQQLLQLSHDTPQ